MFFSLVIKLCRSIPIKSIENDKVLEILGESDKSEQLKEEAPEVEESVDQDNSCDESQKTEEEVFVTIESADNTLDLDDETNKDCEAEETIPLGPDDRECLEQNMIKDTDSEMAIDSAGGQSSQMEHILDNLEDEMKTQAEEEAKDGEQELKNENTEAASTKVSSAKEDDQKMRFVFFSVLDQICFSFQRYFEIWFSLAYFL